jgi:hypothetical protein
LPPLFRLPAPQGPFWKKYIEIGGIGYASAKFPPPMPPISADRPPPCRRFSAFPPPCRRFSAAFPPIWTISIAYHLEMPSPEASGPGTARSAEKRRQGGGKAAADRRKSAAIGGGNLADTPPIPPISTYFFQN